jgi:hypothetical protein
VLARIEEILGLKAGASGGQQAAAARRTGAR